MSTNNNLYKAKKIKNDEFYTQFIDIEKELIHYKEYLKDKIILCNCDNPKKSAFWKYFHLNFESLKLKKLICTYYDNSKPTYKMEYSGGNDNDIEIGIKTFLKGNGDFRTKECIDILDESDIVITNPPFSLFREYINILITHKKKFLIIGNKNVIINKYFFPLIYSGAVWIGYNNVYNFIQIDGSIKKFGNIGWYTNLDIKKRHKKLILNKEYSSDKYKKYDNFDAIDVPRISAIPKDYNGIMGVPITIIEKFCSEQFEIIWQASGNTRVCCPSNILNDVLKYRKHPNDKGGCGVINGKRQYARIFIRKK